MGGLVPNTAVFRAKVWESDGIMRAWSLGIDEPFGGGGSHDGIIERRWEAGSKAYLEEVGY